MYLTRTLRAYIVLWVCGIDMIVDKCLSCDGGCSLEYYQANVWKGKRTVLTTKAPGEARFIIV